MVIRVPVRELVQAGQEVAVEASRWVEALVLRKAHSIRTAILPAAGLITPGIW